jgi:DNA primase large subunit
MDTQLLKDIIKGLLSHGVFAVLFVGFVYLDREQSEALRQEERTERLNNQTAFLEALSEQSDAIKKLASEIGQIKNDVNSIKKHHEGD